MYYYDVLYCTIILYCIVILNWTLMYYYTVLYCTIILYCIVLLYCSVVYYYNVLYCTIKLYCIVLLYCTVLYYYTVLYYTISLKHSTRLAHNFLAWRSFFERKKALKSWRWELFKCKCRIHQYQSLRESTSTTRQGLHKSITRQRKPSL